MPRLIRYKTQEQLDRQRALVRESTRRWREQNKDMPTGLISTSAVIAEERRLRGRKSAPVPRPSAGARCRCGKRLYHYEIPLGKCLKCAASRLDAARYGG